MEPVSVTTEDGTPSIRLNISGRTVYAALKNLLVQHYGITPEKMIAKITESIDVKDIVTKWMNGEHIRAFVGKIAKETVERMAEKVIRDEVRAITNGRIKITIDQG